MVKDIIRELVGIIAEIFGKEESILILLLILGVGGVIIFSVPRIDADSIWFRIVYIIKQTWWFWLFFILLPLAKETFLHWRQEIFKRSINFILLEIKIPREIKKSPQAMEQVLAALHSLRNFPGDIVEKYKVGEITVWFSLEIVSFGGEVHFYIRGQKKQRNLIEAAFFSYYPDIEFELVDDYADKLPQSVPQLYEQKKDMWATEMLLTKEEALPIKTYPAFEHAAEEKQFDPISAFLEVLGKVNRGEFVGMQFLIAPAGPEWKDKWEKFVDDFRKKASSAEEKAGSGETPVMIGRSPGQYEVLKAVENNLSKPAFDTIVRFLYIAPKETYYDSFARRGLVGAFNQYGALNLNSFRQNFQVSTRTMFWYWPHVFPKIRNEYKKQRVLHSYLTRDIPPERFIGRLITSSPFNLNLASERFKLNVEGVATLFHPPTSVVLTAPHIKRVESRKGGAPSGLPIYGEDQEEIKKLFL